MACPLKVMMVIPLSNVMSAFSKGGEPAESCDCYCICPDTLEADLQYLTFKE